MGQFRSCRKVSLYSSLAISSELYPGNSWHKYERRTSPAHPGLLSLSQVLRRSYQAQPAQPASCSSLIQPCKDQLPAATMSPFAAGLNVLLPKLSVDQVLHGSRHPDIRRGCQPLLLPSACAEVEPSPCQKFLRIWAGPYQQYQPAQPLSPVSSQTWRK